jgi:tRNA pseudouridine55 synthase
MRFLLRTRSGIFSLDTAHTLEELTEAIKEGTIRKLLIPMDEALEHLPALNVLEKHRKPFLNGVPLIRKQLTELDLPNGQPVRLYLDHQLYSVGVVDGELIRCKTWLGE